MAVFFEATVILGERCVIRGDTTCLYSSAYLEFKPTLTFWLGISICMAGSRTSIVGLLLLSFRFDPSTLSVVLSR